MEREVVPELCNIMSEETRAVMREIIRDVQAVSSDFWEFVPEGENAIKMGKLDSFPVNVTVSPDRVEIRTAISVLQPHIMPASVIEGDREYFLVELGNDGVLGFELRDGYWSHEFNWQMYAGRKTEVHKLMLLAQFTCLENESWFHRVTRARQLD